MSPHDSNICAHMDRHRMPADGVWHTSRLYDHELYYNLCADDVQDSVIDQYYIQEVAKFCYRKLLMWDGKILQKEIRCGILD